MSVEKYETLGRVILERAGFSGEERLLDKAIGLSTEKQTNAILAVIASELEQIRYLLSSPRAESSAGIPSFPWRNKVVKDDSVDYVADGNQLLSMSYTEPVSFSSTNNYGCGPDDEDDVYTVEEFKRRCESRSFVDYDGFGHPVKDGKADQEIDVYPSKVNEVLPSDATHIVWFNR